MPIFGSADAAVFETHGSRFASYAAPSRGTSQLCAWRLDVPAGLRGIAHRPNREEVLLILEGKLRITLDGHATDAETGQVVVVPANSQIRIDGGPTAASAWVTTTPGLEAVMTDGSRIAPPWAH